MLDPEAAHIDPVEPEPGQRGRKRPRRHQAFFAPGRIAHDITNPRAEPRRHVRVELERPAEVLDVAPPSPWQEAARAYVAGDPGQAAELLTDEQFSTLTSYRDEAHSLVAA